MSNVLTAGVIFRNSSKYPIRFDKLHPGSHFKIHEERSRGMRANSDDRIYKKSLTEFNAMCVSNSNPVVLMPEDLVMPLVRERNR